MQRVNKIYIISMNQVIKLEGNTMKDLYVKVFTGRVILPVEDDFHEVEPYIPGDKLKKGFGYIHDNYVYIYQGRTTTGSNLEHGLYLDRDDNPVFVLPDSERERKKFHVNNIIELDIGRIFDELKDNEDKFMAPEDIEVINNNKEIYTTTIREQDDFLKYIVKRAINDKQVNLKNYRDKFSNQYMLNNMKGGLNKNTKMTVTNFKVWCEVLGLKWTMTIEDDGTDRYSPLPKDFEITSDEF